MSSHIAETDIHYILDTETTGFDPVEDKIVEIGIIKMQGFKKVGQAHWVIDPVIPIPAASTAIHGIDAAKVRGCPTFEDIAEDLLDFIGDGPLVIHNAEFDIRFLNHELAALGHRPLRNKVIDTITIARTKFPGSPANLDALAKRFKIENLRQEIDGRHGALVDAIMLASIWVELEGGRQSNLFAGIKMAPADAAPAMPIAAETASRMPRLVKASAEELAAHGAFLGKEVKNPIWSRA